MTKFATLFILIFSLGFSAAKSQNLLDKVEETFANVNSIHVKGVMCKVEFEAIPGSAVRFEGEIRSTKNYEDFRIRYEQKGEQLNVWIDMPKNITGQNKGLLYFEAPKNVLIKVENISGNVSVIGVGRDNLSVSSVSGSINVSDIPCNASLKSVSGSINATMINGDLNATSTSGSINVSDVTGFANIDGSSGSANIQNVMKTVNASTLSGMLKITGVYSDVKAKSISGLLDLTDIKGKMTLNNTSGEIRLTDIIGDINASTISGAIRGNSVMITGNSNFNSTSGSINFVLLNAEKTLSYELKSASGRIEANGIKGTKELIITEGAIKIKSRTVSGSQKFSN